MNGAGVTIFVFGFVAGAYVFAHVAVALERFRRARGDFRATRQGLRTLVEMMVSRGWQAFKGLLAGATAVAVVVLVWLHHGR